MRISECFLQHFQFIHTPVLLLFLSFSLLLLFPLPPLSPFFLFFLFSLLPFSFLIPARYLVGKKVFLFFPIFDLLSFSIQSEQQVGSLWSWNSDRRGLWWNQKHKITRPSNKKHQAEKSSWEEANRDEAIGQKTLGKLRLEIQSHGKVWAGVSLGVCVCVCVCVYVCFKGFAVMSIEIRGKDREEVKS